MIIVDVDYNHLNEYFLEYSFVLHSITTRQRTALFTQHLPATLVSVGENKQQTFATEKLRTHVKYVDRMYLPYVNGSVTSASPSAMSFISTPSVLQQHLATLQQQQHQQRMW